MKLNEYLAKNAVKLMIKGSGEKNPTRQTNDLGMYDYVENLESVLGTRQNGLDLRLSRKCGPDQKADS